MLVDKIDVQELTEHFDERYVTQRECEERKDEINKKLANDDKRIVLVDHRLKVIEKIAMVIASSVIAQLALSLFTLMLKR